GGLSRSRPGAGGGGAHRVPARGERRPLALSGRVHRRSLGPVARLAGGGGDRQDQAASRGRGDVPDRVKYVPALRARMDMKVERFSLKVDGAVVVGVLHLPSSRPSACVVACHGMGASKDSDKYLLLGREFPAAGLALARFDFRGSGESGGLYRNATVASRVADLEAVLDHLEGHQALDGRFGLLGSSLGGFVALWVASHRSPALPVVTWNAPASLVELAGSTSDDVTAPGAALVAEVREGRRGEAPRGASHVLVVQGDC